MDFTNQYKLNLFCLPLTHRKDAFLVFDTRHISRVLHVASAWITDRSDHDTLPPRPLLSKCCLLENLLLAKDKSYLTRLPDIDQRIGVRCLAIKALSR